MTPIQMIVCDLDNTLLRRDKTISEYTMNIFRKCHKKGILIAFATSRSEEQAKRFIKSIDPDIIITSGGAQASCHSRSVYTQLLPVEVANRVLKRLLAEEQVGFITANTTDGYVINREIDKDDLWWKDYEYGRYFDAQKGFHCEVYELNAEIRDEPVASRILLDFPSVHMVKFTGDNWYQFANIRASKGAALQAVAQHLNIPTDNIVAFGDDNNDLSLLPMAGVGVAMSNAIPEVKAVAKHICGDCDEDGVAHWLEENVLSATSE